MQTLKCSRFEEYLQWTLLNIRSINISIPTTTTTKGSGNGLLKTQKLNLDISPHRAVSAVRLMRIEFGGAFTDLLNEKGKGSGENKMGYVQRMLGFRTRELNHIDLRLVTDIVGGTIRWRKYLDHLISSLCHDKDISNMEPLILQVTMGSIVYTTYEHVCMSH